MIFLKSGEMSQNIEPLVTGDPLSVRMTLMTSKHQMLLKINKPVNK